MDKHWYLKILCLRSGLTLELVILGNFNVGCVLKQVIYFRKGNKFYNSLTVKNSYIFQQVCVGHELLFQIMLSSITLTKSASQVRSVQVSFCTRKITKVQCTKHNIAKTRSLKSYSKDDLLTALVATDWTNVYCSDFDVAWKVFSKKFISVPDKVAPLKEVRIKKKTEPWMNNDTLENIRKRDILLQHFKRENNSGVFEQFCKTRNQIQRNI